MKKIGIKYELKLCSIIKSRTENRYRKSLQKPPSWEKTKIQLGNYFFPVGNLKSGFLKPRIEKPVKSEYDFAKIWKSQNRLDIFFKFVDTLH